MWVPYCTVHVEAHSLHMISSQALPNVISYLYLSLIGFFLRTNVKYFAVFWWSYLSVKPSFLYGLIKLSKFSSVEKENDFSPFVCWSRHNATEIRNLALCFALIRVYKCQILSLFVKPSLVLTNRDWCTVEIWNIVSKVLSAKAPSLEMLNLKDKVHISQVHQPYRILIRISTLPIYSRVILLL